MITLRTVTTLAAKAAIVGALSATGLGLAGGIAAAAPADSTAPVSSATTSSEQHAEMMPGATPAPAAPTADPAIPAHLIPGFTPQPGPTAASHPMLGDVPGLNDGREDNGDACPEVRCRELIDE